MIIAIANQSGSSGKTCVANKLAALRARSGRKVLLLDTDPQPSSGRRFQAELENLGPHYKDIVIDTELRDTPQSRAALIAATLAIVPLQADRLDMSTPLIARLNSARMFNPGLRILFVIVGAEPSEQERAAVRACVARVMSATLAGTVIHAQGAPAGAIGRGVNECRDAHALDEMNALYREVFA